MKRLYSGVYQIVNTVNNKIYIGSSCNIKNRWKQHNFSFIYQTNSKHLQRAWNKYGSNAFKFKVLCYCPLHNLLEKEQEMIDFYKSSDRKYGYNLCQIAGNTLGLICSKKTREKISISLIGRKLTDEHRKNISQGHKGILFTQDHKNKIGLKRKGKLHSEKSKLQMSIRHKEIALYDKANPSKRIDIRLKISKANTGKIREDAVKERISNTLKEYNKTHDNPFKNKKHSNLTKYKMSMAKIGKPSWNKGLRKMKRTIF